MVITTKKVLLDKNIVIDIILARSRKDKILDLFIEFEQFFISVNTFTTCFYVLKKEKFSKQEIYLHLSQFEILEISNQDCHSAFGLARNIDDVEDCLELYTAKRNGCVFMTADHKLVKNYSLLFDLLLI